MKKRLLITASTFPRFVKDTEPRFILDLAKNMTQYAQVTVLAPAAPGAADEEVLEGVHVIRYHYFPIHAWETLCYPGAIVPRIRQKKVRAFLVPGLFVSLGWHLLKMKDQYDMVHANWLIPQGIVQSFIKKPYVVTGHGADVTSLNSWGFRLLKERCLRRAMGVTTVSAPLMDVLNSIYTHPNQALISMGCDTKLFGEQHRVDNYFNQGADRVILFVGRLAQKKGVQYLIEAMQYLEDVKLVIVGDGPLRHDLELQAEQVLQSSNIGMNHQKDMKIHRSINFLGARTHEELKTIYASADIFVMPSVTAKDGDKEGFGLVMLEAFASGLPVVASRSGGIVDLIHDGENGFLVSEKDVKGLAEKINILLHNRTQYEKMKATALTTAAAYDYEIIARKYAGFLNL